MILPILHIASDPIRTASSLDVPAIVIALSAPVLAFLVVWGLQSPRIGRIRSPRAPRHQIASLLVLVFVVLPNAMPWDHVWLHHDDADEAGAGSVHSMHCHESPATCSDMPLLSGPGQLIFSDPYLVEPQLQEVQVLSSRSSPAGRTPAPDIPPPRL